MTFYQLLNGSGAGAHENNDAFRILCTAIVKQAILAASELSEAVHRCLDSVRTSLVVRIHGFAGLEKHIWVLGRASQDRAIGIQTASAVLVNEFVIDHRLNLFRRQRSNSVDFVGRPKTVKEMQKWNA